MNKKILSIFALIMALSFAVSCSNSDTTGTGGNNGGGTSGGNTTTITAANVQSFVASKIGKVDVIATGAAPNNNGDKKAQFDLSSVQAPAVANGVYTFATSIEAKNSTSAALEETTGGSADTAKVKYSDIKTEIEAKLKAAADTDANVKVSKSVVTLTGGATATDEVTVSITFKDSEGKDGTIKFTLVKSAAPVVGSDNTAVSVAFDDKN